MLNPCGWPWTIYVAWSMPIPNQHTQPSEACSRFDSMNWGLIEILVAKLAYLRDPHSLNTLHSNWTSMRIYYGEKPALEGEKIEMRLRNLSSSIQLCKELRMIFEQWNNIRAILWCACLKSRPKHTRKNKNHRSSVLRTWRCIWWSTTSLQINFSSSCEFKFNDTQSYSD